MTLMTAEIEKKLKENDYYPQTEDWMKAEVIVKYFFPAGAATWLIVGGEEVENDWRLFGYVTLGFDWEWGSVFLSQLENYTGFMGLKIERDLYCEGECVEDLVMN